MGKGAWQDENDAVHTKQRRGIKSRGQRHQEEG